MNKPHQSPTRRWTLSALALALTAWGGSAQAQSIDKWPEKPIKILVGFPPGGSVDVIARLLADKLRVSLGQNVIVDNKPGAGGRVALNEIKKAAPDGGASRTAGVARVNWVGPQVPRSRTDGRRGAGRLAGHRPFYDW